MVSPCYDGVMVAPYFAFLDGAFRYDCASCGQACCRGKGIALSASRELVPLLARAPQIAPLLHPLAGGYVRLPDVTDGCWFLASDGMCSYETTHGRSAKFTTCRLFPFNRVFRLGSAQVVDVNSVVCPIQDAYGTGRGVRHEELLSELAALGKDPLLDSTVPLPQGARELRWLMLETTLRDDSATYLQEVDYQTFAQHQQAQTERHLGLRGTDPQTEIRELQHYFDSIYGSLVAALAPAQRAQVSRALTLLSPSLRFNALFRKGVDDYRRTVLSLPSQLLATSVLSLGATALWNKPLSLRALTELHQAQSELRQLLGRLREPATLDGPLTTPELPTSVKDAVSQLSDRLRQPKSATIPLGQHLILVGQSLPAAERALLPSVLVRAGESLRFVSSRA